jgi:MT0933-like antitoxin protein
VSIFDSAKEKLQELTESHGDQVEQFSDQAIEKAGDLADEKTGGQFAEHVDTAQQAADGAIGT